MRTTDASRRTSGVADEKPGFHHFDAGDVVTDGTYDGLERDVRCNSQSGGERRPVVTPHDGEPGRSPLGMWHVLT
jgi:hypothetical protein